MHYTTLLTIIGLTVATVNSKDCAPVAILKTQFNKTDLNHDGIVMNEEFLALFEGGLDANKDGHLTEDEYLDATRLPPFWATLHYMYFDKDNNDVVTESEFGEIFNDYDLNKNGEVTESEYLSAYA